MTFKAVKPEQMQPIDAFRALQHFIFLVEESGFKPTDEQVNAALKVLLRFFQANTQKEFFDKANKDMLIMYQEIRAEITKHYRPGIVCYIQITQASNDDLYWYSDHIGEIYPVYSVDETDFFTRPDGSMLVLKTDCDVL